MNGKTSVFVRLTEDLKKRLEERAASENRSISAHVVNLIERDLSSVDIPIVGKIEGNTIRLSKEYQEYLKSPIDPRD